MQLNSATQAREALQQKKNTLLARAKIVRAVRDYFEEEGFLEVSTPIRVSAPAPELNIDTEPSGDRFLIASPELHMKRLVAAGYEKIFQTTKCFRQNEQGAHHLPEFTMLEWYETGATLETLKTRCEGICISGAKAIGRFPSFSFGKQIIQLAQPWESLEVQDAFERFADWRPGATPDPLRFDIDLVEKVEPALPGNRPIFLTGYPRSMASLAKIDPNNPDRALRMELYLGGLELANGFEELTDARIQRNRFAEEEQSRRDAGKPPYPVDEYFLDALKLGLPPCAGMAMGLDRLIMLLADAPNIQMVVPFADEDMNEG